jgi:hypothetical protein
MMQPYLDGVLSEEQIGEAQEHLERCRGCDKRFRFEAKLRRYVRIAAHEAMSDGLKEKLAGLRSVDSAG